MVADRYRLFIDESGDAQVEDVTDPRYRYLGLTGIAIRLDRHQAETGAEMDGLKARHFPAHSSNAPVVLVRTELIRTTGAFSVLADPGKAAAWERDVLAFLDQWARDPITVVIDKLRTQQMYGEQDEDPYLRAMRFMLERYRGMLHYRGAVGDVMFEARGTAEDRRLRQAYRYLYAHGTGQRSGEDLRAVLTSGELKIQKKRANVAGLQVADLIAAPARLSLLQEHRGNPPLSGKFTQRVIERTRPRYHRANRVIFPKRG